MSKYTELITAIISAYHTTRSTTSAEDHIWSKLQIREMFKDLSRAVWQSPDSAPYKRGLLGNYNGRVISVVKYPYKAFVDDEPTPVWREERTGRIIREPDAWLDKEFVGLSGDLSI